MVKMEKFMIGTRKKLENLLSKKGDLTLLENQIMNSSNKEDIFDALICLLKATTSFQKKHWKTLNKIMSDLKDQETIFVLLLPLINIIEKCGLDNYKKTNPEKISLKATGKELASENISVYSHFNQDELPIPLNYIKTLKNSESLILKATFEDVSTTCERFFEENSNDLLKIISNLKKEIKK